jgi:hypothetical protein
LEDDKVAYIPSNYDFLRRKYLGEGAPAASGIAGGFDSGNAAPAAPAAPSQVGTGRFAALKSYLDANQPIADQQAANFAQGVQAKAQEAQTKTTQAAATPENFGGAGLSGEAETARQSALDQIKAAGSQGGLEGLVDTKHADYTLGMRGADAYLYGRSAPVQGLSSWEPVLSALKPTPGAALKDTDVIQAPNLGAWEYGRKRAESDQSLAQHNAYLAWKKKYDQSNGT